MTYTLSWFTNPVHRLSSYLLHRMYQDKLANLKKQLEELEANTHPEYVRRLRKLENQYKERMRQNEVYREYTEESIEHDFVLEKRSAAKEFEDKRADLKENLISDLEEKRKNIESERYTMELTGDSTEPKPTITRKLRRRPNDPLPVTAEKRRKPTVGQLTLLLEDKEIESDLKAISRGKNMTPVRPTQSNNNGTSPSGPGSVPGNSSTSSNENYPLVEARVEDGKLLYERRWFHRGQSVYIEGKDVVQFPANITAIGNDVVSDVRSMHKYNLFNVSQFLIRFMCFVFFVIDLGEETEWQQQNKNPHQSSGAGKNCN